MTTATEVKPEPVTLSKDEILRYSRHLIMPEVGMDGQLKLKNAKVLLIGTGGLGAPAAQFLAAAGINVVVNPFANSLIQGRLDVYPKRRGFAQRLFE